MSLSGLVDGPQYIPDTYVVNGIEVRSPVGGTGAVWQTVKYSKTILGKPPGFLSNGAWTTVRHDVDRIAKTTTVSANGTLIGSWPISLDAAKGTKIMINSGGSICWKNMKVYKAD